jgi:exopolysaccharide biosynthesis polyprenyl glycosylphosphotransferase
VTTEAPQWALPYAPGPRVKRPLAQMAADRSQRKRFVLMALDLALVASVGSLATALFILQYGGSLSTNWSSYGEILALSLPGWFIAFVQARLYSARFISRGVDELRRLVIGVVLGTTFLALASVLLRVQVERAWYFSVGAAVFVAVGIERWIVRSVFNRWRRSGRMSRRVVVVGSNQEGEAIEDLLERQPQLGYSVVGRVYGDSTPGAIPDANIVEHTLDLVEEVGATGVVIASSAIQMKTSTWLIRELTESGIHVELSSTLLDIASKRITVRALGRLPVFYIEPVMRDGWRARAKRVFDVVLSATLLILMSPIMLVCVIAIKLTSSGPALFRQTRIGRDGQLFTIYKLRTMVVGAETMLVDLADDNELDGPLFKMRRDPRVTRVGRFLRSTSLDEVPQLWNVLRGDMALVGPRPALPSEVQQWPTQAFQRLRVKPGLTGMWQVSGRNLTVFEEYIRLDLYYVDNWSMLNDLAIIAKTVPTVLRRQGAY